MPIYKAPVDDTLFLLNDVFQIERHNNLPGFAERPPDVVEAVLNEGAKLCEEVLAPLNRSGDQRGLQAPRRRQRHDAEGLQGRVRAPTRDGGWIGLAVPPEFGGQGLPYTLAGDRQRVRLARQHGVRACIRA